jgi:hypothetical protein
MGPYATDHLCRGYCKQPFVAEFTGQWVRVHRAVELQLLASNFNSRDNVAGIRWCTNPVWYALIGLFPIRTTTYNASLTGVQCAPDLHCKGSRVPIVCAEFPTQLQRLCGVVGAIKPPNEHSRHTRATPNIHTHCNNSKPSNFSQVPHSIELSQRNHSALLSDLF